MERSDEEVGAQESPRRGAGQVRRARSQRGQAAGQPGKWPQGRFGQKPQEDHRGAAQCAPATAWTPHESLNALVEKIRARFGDYAIGRGDGGIRYSAPTLR
jgi:hypothetical protein